MLRIPSFERNRSVEFAIDLVAEYAGLVAPALAFWAAMLLHLQPKDTNSSVVQSLYFLILMFVAVLTVRATTSHDPMWLANAASLGALIVIGVLKRPADHLDSAWLQSEF
jgi:peptidoglycan/LPS O-acetylase OafA/YrhL